LQEPSPATPAEAIFEREYPGPLAVAALSPCVRSCGKRAHDVTLKVFFPHVDSSTSSLAGHYIVSLGLKLNESIFIHRTDLGTTHEDLSVDSSVSGSGGNFLAIASLGQSIRPHLPLQYFPNMSIQGVHTPVSA
jgi:hypothetical protein